MAAMAAVNSIMLTTAPVAAAAEIIPATQIAGSLPQVVLANARIVCCIV